MTSDEAQRTWLAWRVPVHLLKLHRETLAAIGPLVSRVAGIERRPIRFEVDGLKRSVQAADLVDQACEGLASATRPGEAIVIDNTAHPVNTRVSLAKATRSRIHAFGIDWDDATGTRNGHFAPFSWAG